MTTKTDTTKTRWTNIARSEREGRGDVNAYGLSGAGGTHTDIEQILRQARRPDVYDLTLTAELVAALDTLDAALVAFRATETDADAVRTAEKTVRDAFCAAGGRTYDQ